MLPVLTLSDLTTQCGTRYYGPRAHSPATCVDYSSHIELRGHSGLFVLLFSVSELLLLRAPELFVLELLFGVPLFPVAPPALRAAPQRAGSP